MKSSITLGLALFIRQISAFYGFGSCGIPRECQQEISAPYFMGTWYVVQQDWVDRIWNSQDLCTAYVYSLDESGKVTKEIESNRLFQGEQLMGFKEEDLQQYFGWHIVRTDYENYAVFFTCSDPFGLFHYTSVKILSRTPTLKEAYLIQALAFLQDTCSYAADLDLISAYTVGCDMPDLPKFDPETQTRAVNITADAVVVSWQRASMVEAYKVEVTNSEGDWEELSECPSAGLVQMEKPSCSLSYDVIIALPLGCKVRVIGLIQDEELLIVPPTTLNDGSINPRSPKVWATGGSWTTMTFECEDLGIPSFKYELLKYYGNQCSPPSDWDTATVIGPAQTSTTFTVSTSLDYYFVACRAIQPNGEKVEVKDFLHMEKNGWNSPTIALNARITEASTSGVTIAWDPPVDNGESPYVYWVILKEGNNCNSIASSGGGETSPATFSASLTSGSLYSILIDYTNGSDGDYSEIFLFFTVE